MISRGRTWRPRAAAGTETQTQTQTRGSSRSFSRRLRILRIADVPEDHAGGIRLAMRATSELLVERGHTVHHLFSSDMPTPGPQALRRVLLPWVILVRVARARRYADAPDVVEIHEPLGAPYALARALSGRRALPPLVLFSHGLEERGWRAQRDRWRRRGDHGSLKTRIVVPFTLVAQARVAIRYADAVVVLSSQDRHFLLKRKLRPSRIHQINNGVHPKFLAIEHLPRPSAAPMHLIFVGSWVDRKGVCELADAFTRLCLKRSDVRLVIAGSGVSTAEVASHFPAFARTSLDIYPSITRAALASLLAHADVFVLPSWFEGMPLSLLEAAGAQLPTVASDTCGIRDILRPDDPSRDGGRLIPPHDSEALYAALADLLDDPAGRARLGTNARERARSFTWKRAAVALEQVYLDTAAPL